MTEQERLALHLLTTSLLKIRLMTRDSKQLLTDDEQRAICDLADAWHNVPGHVANESTNPAYLAQTIEEVRALHARL